jgi:hypothetical protein
LGALLTTFILSTILTRFEENIGMPKNILYNLSMVAGIFALYSISCSFFVPKNWRFFLKGIAIANFLYCCTTLGLIIALRQSLTALGIIYFGAEIVVIASLLLIELSVAYKP